MKNELITAIIAFVLFMVLLFFFAITLAIRYRRRKRENELLKARFVQERLRIQVEIQEETLQHISRELHDNFGHIASLIKINLNTISLPDSAMADKLEDTRELTRQLIGDIKQLSVSLSNNRIAQKGLIPAIEAEAERLRRIGLFAVSLVIEDVIPAIDKDKALILYRMIQEIIGNIIKHSKATTITISLLHKSGNIMVGIADNGIGFNKDSVLAGEGAGLRNLQTRASLIHAVLSIDSTEGQGSTISINIPS